MIALEIRAAPTAIHETITKAFINAKALVSGAGAYQIAELRLSVADCFVKISIEAIIVPVTKINTINHGFSGVKIGYKRVAIFFNISMPTDETTWVFP